MRLSIAIAKPQLIVGRNCNNTIHHRMERILAIIAPNFKKANAALF
ncbi:hypothetical protein [Nostoc sp. NIES-3756]|nr:hypothetical protein [Nostoc sp. NIES-3756]